MFIVNNKEDDSDVTKEGWKNKQTKKQIIIKTTSKQVPDKARERVEWTDTG